MSEGSGKMIRQDEWRWFGDAGHFICSRKCEFHLCTQVGKHLISTVGKLWNERTVREIYARIYDKDWFIKNKHLLGDKFDHAYMKKFGYEEIGHNRKYESMVFKAGKPCDAEDCNCGLPKINGSELDSRAYNDAKSARKGHMELCFEFANGIKEDLND